MAVFYRTKVPLGKLGSVFVMSKIKSFGHDNYILTVIESLKMTWIRILEKGGWLNGQAKRESHREVRVV